jgi:hypothetical protein
MTAAVDDDHVTTTRSEQALGERDAVPPGGDTRFPQGSLGPRLQQGLADRVFEPGAGLRKGLRTDDGDVARRAPVGVVDVLRNVARCSTHQRHPGQPPVLVVDEGLSVPASVAAVARASCSKRLRRSLWAASSSGMTLTATSRPRRVSRAR